MHILIGAITAIAGLLWALNSLQRSGVDLNAFNPFTWVRRRKWEKLYGRKPLYELDKPLEAAAAIIVGLLNQEGIISKEQKQHITELFKSNFNLNEKESTELLVSSTHLVKDELNIERAVANILALSKDKFSPEMVDTFLSILKSVASLEGTPSDSQLKIIDNVALYFKAENKNSEWG
mgnify:CR=1 FL=1